MKLNLENIALSRQDRKAIALYFRDYSGKPADHNQCNKWAKEVLSKSLKESHRYLKRCNKGGVALDDFKRVNR